MIIAIDGPGGSGKSSTARAVARKLGFAYLDTGAMYRALALHLLRTRTDALRAEMTEVLQAFALDVVEQDGMTRVLVDGSDVTEKIRSPEVSVMASRISSDEVVRSWMVERQRSIALTLARKRGVVVEGRDIGTVVFPDADLKVYMDARDEVRARRRLEELTEQGVEASIEAVLTELRERDARDSERKVSPMRRAVDAMLVDTSDTTFEEQVARVVEAVEVAQLNASGHHHP